VIDRADQCVNLCEIKFYQDELLIDKEYLGKLHKKKECFERVTGSAKATFLTLITTHGVKHNDHFHSVIDQDITMNALFVK
jgi:hypothetical protein